MGMSMSEQIMHSMLYQCIKGKSIGRVEIHYDVHGN